MSFQQEKEDTIKFIRQVFQNIKIQVVNHYKTEEPIRDFTSLIKSFNALKDKVPDYKKKYLSLKEQEEVKKLQILSDQIKTILIKSTQLNSKYIGRSCDYLNELTLAFEPEERQTFFNKEELQLLYELNRLCKDHTLQEFVHIDFLPSSLQTLDEAGNDLVYESHYKAFQLLIELTLNRKEKELKSGTNTNLNGPFYSYLSVRKAQDNIEKAFEPHKQTLYQNSWSIDQFRHSLTNILNECQHIDVESANGSLFNCKIQNDRFILKTSNSRGYGYPGILHEFVIGSWLNQIRDINPGLMFTYGGFFCSPFDTEIKDLCKLEYNKVALTTILITEFIEGKPLKSFANSPSLPRLLKQVYYTLKIAYDKFRFCHNDLHSSNILVRELPRHEKIHYSNTFIESDMIPVLIDFGTSTIDLMTKDKQVLTPLRAEARKVLHLYCFPPDIMNKDQPTIESKISQHGIAGYPSYDWLRLLITLSSIMEHPSVLIPFIQPFIEYKNTHSDKYLPEDPTSIWLENVLNDRKCNSFFPTHNYPFFYEFNIYKNRPLL
jgi:hypothetical protein